MCDLQFPVAAQAETGAVTEGPSRKPSLRLLKKRLSCGVTSDDSVIRGDIFVHLRRIKKIFPREGWVTCSLPGPWTAFAASHVPAR